MKEFKSIHDMCLMDDAFMSAVFDNCTEASQEVLRIILERDDITVIDSKTQMNFTNSFGKSIRLDILAKADDGSTMNIEIQRVKDQNLMARAEFYSAMLLSRNLRAGDSYLNLSDSCVIFICDFDYYETGLPLYHIDRVVRELPGLKQDEKMHIIFVGGLYQNDDPIGHLMDDFHATSPDSVSNGILSKRVRHFKESKGVLHS